MMDIKQYMTDLGRRARKAARVVARAETAAKNTALEAMADAIERDEALTTDASVIWMRLCWTG